MQKIFLWILTTTYRHISLWLVKHLKNNLSSFSTNFPHLFTFSTHFGPSPVIVFWTLSPASSTFRYSRLQSIFIIPCSFATSSKMIAPPIVNAARRPTLADANPVTLSKWMNKLIRMNHKLEMHIMKIIRWVDSLKWITIQMLLRLGFALLRTVC